MGNPAWVALFNSRIPSLVGPFGFLEPATEKIQNCKILSWKSRLDPFLDSEGVIGPSFLGWKPVITSSKDRTLEYPSVLNGLALGAIWALFFTVLES